MLLLQLVFNYTFPNVINKLITFFYLENKLNPMPIGLICFVVILTILVAVNIN